MSSYAHPTYHVKTVYIIKWCLTSSTLIVDDVKITEDPEDPRRCGDSFSYRNAWLKIGRDAFLTEAEALQGVERLRASKIEAAQRQIKRLKEKKITLEYLNRVK